MKEEKRCFLNSDQNTTFAQFFEYTQLQKVNTEILKWTILLILVVIWGTSYILMKRGLESYTAMQVGALRLSITFVCLLPFAVWKLRSVKKEQLKFLAIAGVIGSGIPAYLFAAAQKGIDSQVAGILNSVAPLFTLLTGVLFFGFRTKWYNVTGVFIGLAGAIGLLSAGDDNTFNLKFGFGLYIIIATILYATNINLVKKYLKEVAAITIASFSFIFIGLPSLIYLLAGTDFTLRISSSPEALKNFGYVAVLSVIGTAFANIAYNYLIKISSILFVASVTYLIPIVAIIWGMNDGENFYIGYFLWMALIFIGVFLVNKNVSEA